MCRLGDPQWQWLAGMGPTTCLALPPCEPSMPLARLPAYHCRRLGPMSSVGVAIAGGFAASVVAVTGIAVFKGQLGGAWTAGCYVAAAWVAMQQRQQRQQWWRR